MQSAVLNCRTHIYRRREPEKEVLYQAIADNLETFLERLRAEGHELPKYAVEEFYRAGLEQLCSYVTRPPLAASSLEKVADDKYLFKLKSSWSDGTSYIILSGHELLEKLAAIVPPPRSHTTRYHGLLAPNSKLRAKVVPANSNGNTPSEERKKSGSTKYRLTFAALLARVFQRDVSVCHECGGRMKIIAFITDPASVQRYLRGEGLPTQAPPIAPASSPPQMEFDLCSDIPSVFGAQWQPTAILHQRPSTDPNTPP
jgi:hypothetical protein